MTTRKPMNLSQTLIDSGGDDNCSITTIPFSDLKEDHLSVFEEALPLGLSAAYWNDSNKLALLVIVGKEHGVAVEFPQPVRRKGKDVPATIDIESEGYQALMSLLIRNAGEFYAFDMAPLSMALYLEQGLRLVNAVDIQSAFPEANRYSIAEVLKAALGTELKIYEKNLADAFNDITYNPEQRTSVLDPAQRAWLAHYLATVGDAMMTYNDVPRIDTLDMDDALLDVIAKVTIDSQRLEHKRPGQINHEFQYEGHDTNTNEHRLTAMAFKNRFRRFQDVRVVVSDPAGSFTSRGRVDASGKLAFFSSTGGGIGDRAITSIIGLGREPPTLADKARDENLLRLLQRVQSPDNPWLKNIWFNKDAASIKWPDTWFSDLPKLPQLSRPAQASLALAASKLNASQQVVVNAMLSANPITIIQGPPGTGKTSVIAFFVQMALSLGRRGIWLIAQSNVAVKNIAEKLSNVGFNDYRLLVSQEFIKDWHDHLYTDVFKNVIDSSEFRICESRIRGCKIMLCTLSMLSSIWISKVFAKVVPLMTLVVDEASQIHIGDYISVFYKYPGLQKACFIGDDKQLPPFGQEDAPDQGLPSIFEVEHLRDYALFLDTQYRMPPQTGDMISETVYDGMLRSNPGHPISNNIMACHFIDVASGEKRREDSYWNEGERDMVIQIAAVLQENKQKYKIISPYDAQRNAIEKKMEDKGMMWGNTCFNVDSFQGNEEDYIIISLVRSRELGFLKNLCRTNVMLTRFKRGMFIVSSKKFLYGPGKDCLVGEIAQKVGDSAWLSQEDVAKGRFFGHREVV